MSKWEDKVSAIYRLRFSNPEDALREVADQVLEGNDDPLFRTMLAHMIHPDRRPVGGRKLVLKGPKHAPPRARNWELEEFVEIQVDIHNVPTKVVFHAAEKRFGVSRTTVTDALKRCREDRDPDVFKEHKEMVLGLSKRDHPHYVPISDPKK
ncbi:hypothetical protein FIU85_05630 [Roseovarius sp. THAF8]|uniref:hypothetical protein n=1 Tax=Roseovarius sp. THAF8 TaxID=2587846 RepID=UPI00126826D3|nr:hypothetical protein [Roseovarius sp. THAF8]QFT96771.1 hypothetical protein FIU85_05630 [Roseovarius sp. THAF8]